VSSSTPHGRAPASKKITRLPHYTASISADNETSYCIKTGQFFCQTNLFIRKRETVDALNLAVVLKGVGDNID